MSATDGECAATDPSLCEFPEFALAAMVDDADDPNEVTVYPLDADEDALPTAWLTVDAGAAVDLAAAR